MASGMVVWLASGDRNSPGITPTQLFGPLDLGHRLMLAGILVVASTPALRVVALLGLWVQERSWRFAITAALVLLLLGIAFWAGRG
jgi:hypothetical protein